MQNLPTTFPEPVLLGIIGGTGLYHLDGLVPVAKLVIQTPWGSPSSPIIISRTPSGMPVAFLSRHGVHHQYSPSDVPYQANIAALKHIGVETIIAFSAVGSLRGNIKPRDFVIPNQVIDRTKGIRTSSFFKAGFVAHVGFGNPFDDELAAAIAQHASSALQGDNVLLHTRQTEKANGFSDVTLICMEGPAFSTRAESNLYRSWGGHVINMSCLPESKLAKEAEIAYQMVCMSTDYDAWREEEEAVTVEMVVSNLKANSENANRVIVSILNNLEHDITNHRFGKSLRGSMRLALSTGQHGIDRKLYQDIQFLHPGHYDLAN
ncbi:hypothetical protein CANCADRAFT_2060 [Tortispora caseinolytica NRRL Y-17796]|uniref:S-methyl-5'-thioadenosine phosphorylase n=1 Tax=Tortispora caseinolytica NRRL Y-17796 TaxID=767744 RepID=A0A1E4TEX6_9ASCO|nr:hypothetical protein CANCADRAFT_2060 [Tortispora caseinolytica NRRL Y-17796]